MKRFLAGLLIFVAGLGTGLLLPHLWPGWGSSAGTLSRPFREITLSAEIDGSDRFVFTADHAWNDHLRWERPKNVLFNGEPWTDLSQAPARWVEFARELDLRKAEIVTRDGRDIIALEPTLEGFDLYFSDSTTGKATYEVILRIPHR